MFLSAGWRGLQKNHRVSNFFKFSNLFFIITVDMENSEATVNKFARDIELQNFRHLSDLDAFIFEEIKKLNLPPGISLALGFIKDNGTVYLKTVGEGIVYLRRGRKFAKIIEGDNSASGVIQNDDKFVFTTTRLVEAIQGEDKIKNITDEKLPESMVEKSALNLSVMESNPGSILFVRKVKDEDNRFSPTVPLKLEQPFSKFKLDKKIKIGLGILVIVFISVLVFLRIQGGGLKNDRIFKNANNLIRQDLNEAKKYSNSDVQKSQEAIQRAKDELSSLKKEVGKDYQQKISSLQELINNTEKEVLEAQMEKPKEFYDLTLLDKNIEGKNLTLYDSDLSILTNNQFIYTLSLDDKATKRFKNDVFKSGQFVTTNNNGLFVLVKEKGIYKVNDDKSIELIIEATDDWNDVKDFKGYGSNLYILRDDNIYKFTPVSAGYSGALQYFPVDKDLESASSFAIDKYVYVAFSDTIVRYLSGKKDEIKFEFPKTSFKIYKIFTNKDIDMIYVWDKDNGETFVFDKEGEYQRSILSSVLKKASDLVAYNGKIFVVYKNKILTLE